MRTAQLFKVQLKLDKTVVFLCNVAFGKIPALFCGSKLQKYKSLMDPVLCVKDLKKLLLAAFGSQRES